MKVIDRVEVDIGITPLMAASEDGRIAILYYDGRERLRLAVREPGGDFEVASVGRAASGDLALDVGLNGDIVVAWRDFGVVKARVQRRGHGLGRVEVLGPTETTATVDASVADDGHVAVAWSNVDFRSGPGGETLTASSTVVRAAIRPPGPRLFEAAQTLYDSGEPRGPQTSVTIDSSATGATVAWTESEVDTQGTQRFPILTATTDAARRFEAPVSIPAEGAVEDIALTAGGSTSVAWTPMGQSVGLFAASRPAGGTAFGPQETVTDRPASFAKFALNPQDGRSTLIWNGTDDSGNPALPASTRE
ncbi:MAG: hypothetical protein MSC31_16770 [Solirubrobacteraceae bacterium MAG38_C4-C5]|nr:hypothetical protein [Candidatus Siliceabacter maunaloa]